VKTKSEAEFQKFLTENNLSFEKVKEEDSRRPDYLVDIGNSQLLFEIKELAEDDNFTTEPLVVYSRIVGDHIRRKIADARKQVQFGAKQGIPSILLIYNNLDPIHLFGTENFDFIAAMYGEYTIVLDRESGKQLDAYYGRKNSLAPERNTSFSAVGRLLPVRGKLEVTLFENAFAKIKLPFELLPSCFEVRRCDITFSGQN
jgi:hypothetical protein